jgi:hypothetical protein
VLAFTDPERARERLPRPAELPVQHREPMPDLIAAHQALGRADCGKGRSRAPDCSGIRAGRCAAVDSCRVSAERKRGRPAARSRYGEADGADAGGPEPRVTANSLVKAGQSSVSADDRRGIRRRY